MKREDDEGLRARITRYLADSPSTKTEPFPKDDREIQQILSELRRIPKDDLVGKLVEAGFVDHPYGEDQQRCLECMYFLMHRRWCDLPELDVPAEQEWWCRLWRL